ncbi:MAG: hypothetical protein C0392_14210 [Syntrophus sp. (in: bacteria)]|nr:hypothetical protein [Syntrophus sp. (in: bacteria)]
MDYTINSTKEYHLNQLNTLGWELTICNALYPENSPLRKHLRNNDSYGHLLYDYLYRLLPMGGIKKVIEIGGGYGYLMKDFLDRNESLEVSMVDISPYLLQKQKETLRHHDVSYREEDFLEVDPAVLAGFDLAVLNENLGDFPTLTNLSCNIFESAPEMIDPNLKRVQYVFEQYSFDRPKEETFNLNIGAINALEKLCASGIPYIYLGEHSCEASAPQPLRHLINIESAEDPEKISLMGHDEYSIKFSYLQQIAHAFNYASIRGPFADYVPFDVTEELRFIMASQGRYKDEDEVVCQFIEDLYKYEYLILMK